jgi:hypothetical protein
VREGVKNQSVTVVLGKPAAATPAATSAAPASGAQAMPDTPPASASSGGGSPLRTVGWIAGGVGVVGLGIGTAFGIAAISDKSSAHCDASNACQSGPLSSANSAATISTVGFVAGGVLLAGGLALVLFAPKASGPDTTGTAPAKTREALRITPLVGSRNAGLMVGGSW